MNDGGVECGSAVACSSSSKITLGSSWAEPLTFDSDDEATGSLLSIIHQSSLSGTHAGMLDFTRLVSFLGTKKGQILDTGLIYDELPPGLLTKVLMLAKFLRMELSAPGKGLVHCMDRADRPLWGSSKGTYSSPSR